MGRDRDVRRLRRSLRALEGKPSAEDWRAAWRLARQVGGAQVTKLSRSSPVLRVMLKQAGAVET